jgi:hypothetical protein
MSNSLGTPAPHAGHDNPLSLPRELLQALGLALRSIQYGTVELVIHDGRVVQLEKREKVRVKSAVIENGRQ